MQRVPMPGGDHVLVRRNRTTGAVDYLPVIAFLIDMDGASMGGAPLPDAIAATGDRLHEQMDRAAGDPLMFDTAVRMPSGRCVDFEGEYQDDNEWIAACMERCECSPGFKRIGG